MAIIKQNNRKSVSISGVNFKPIDVYGDEINGEAYLNEHQESAIKDLTQKGYSDGFDKGKSEGYLEGKLAFEVERKRLEDELVTKNENLHKVLEAETLNCISNMQNELSKIVVTSINKIFFNTINNADIMNVYMDNLVKYIETISKDFILYANEFTLESPALKNKEINCEINTQLKDYDLVVKVSDEYREYFLDSELTKIKTLFE